MIPRESPIVIVVTVVVKVLPASDIRMTAHRLSSDVFARAAMLGEREEGERADSEENGVRVCRGPLEGLGRRRPVCCPLVGIIE